MYTPHDSSTVCSVELAFEPTRNDVTCTSTDAKAVLPILIRVELLDDIDSWHSAPFESKVELKLLSRNHIKYCATTKEGTDTARQTRCLR